MELRLANRKDSQVWLHTHQRVALKIIINNVVSHNFVQTLSMPTKHYEYGKMSNKIDLGVLGRYVATGFA